MNNGMGANWLAEQIALQYSIPIPLVEIVSEEEIIKIGEGLDISGQ